MNIHTQPDDWTLEQFVNWARQTPITGQTTRQEFEKFQKGGTRIIHQNCVVLAGHNYQCLETYSPTQKINLLGVYLNVYTDYHCCSQGSTTNPDDIPNLFESLANQARQQCEHSYGRELSQQECREKNIRHFGNCWHVYECPKCGEIFSVDSSG